MVAKSSANENKVFSMTVRKPRPKLRQAGRDAGKACKSGRGEVFLFILAISPTTNSLFFVLIWIGDKNDGIQNH